MSDKGEPRRSVTIVFWMVILGENTPHHVSVNLDAQGIRYDSRNARISKAGVPAFQFDDSVDKFL